MPTPQNTVIPAHGNAQLIGDPVSVINAAERAFRTIQAKAVALLAAAAALSAKLEGVEHEATDELKKVADEIGSLHAFTQTTVQPLPEDAAGAAAPVTPPAPVTAPAPETKAPEPEVDPTAGPKDETPAQAANETSASDNNREQNAS